MKRSTWLTIAAAAVGLLLAAHAATVSSATYDETTYLRVASRWWRTGDQQEISRMGSPVTFWKIQLAPVYLALDYSGYREWVDDPIANQARLLPLARVASLWVWLAGFGLTVAWARRRGGAEAGAFTGWVFALSPNLLAHGGLLTMEMPLIAASVGAFASFDRYLESRRRRDLILAAVACGLAFSMKFTAVLFPPLLALTLVVTARPLSVRDFAREMLLFGCVMVATNLAVTGFAVLPLSEGVGSHPFLERKFGQVVARLAETPLPADWVGFLNQVKHQRGGGPSYLFGEVRMTGWWYYYLVAIAVKVPIGVFVLVAARISRRMERDGFIGVLVLGFVAVAMLMSKRNYGIRYLLPVAPAVIVWLSDLARIEGVRPWAARAGIASMAAAIAWIHPYELSFFNRAAGGVEGGRRILADSNLDWGQGLRSLAALQALDESRRDITLYYFGDTDPAWYGVTGKSVVVTANDERNNLPPFPSAETKYLGVSSSLVWGPWGRPARFEVLRGLKPVATTKDGTILIHETAAVARVIAAVSKDVRPR